MKELGKFDLNILDELRHHSRLVDSEIEYLKNALVIQKKTFKFLELAEPKDIDEPIKAGGTA